MRALAACALLLACACAPEARAPRVTMHTPAEFLQSVTVAWPGGEDPGRLVMVSPGADRVAIYDNALAVLLDVRLGRRDDAARILHALAKLQREDGSLPFSFRLEDALDPAPYIRAGALAWVGYAAVAYLDADSEGGARDEVIRMCHALARYLIAHQVQAPGDLRQGMVTGGDGTLTYSFVKGQVQEDFEPGAIPWVSTEHNIDTFFFLRALAKVAERPDYAAAASRIQRALEGRFWNGGAGQMNRGGEAKEVDTFLALDCASWSALFLLAEGDRMRAETALAVADARYATSDRARGASGHRPYASGPLLESDVLAKHYTLPVRDWESSSAVWPEGSAGVALAALRLGKRERAEAILRGLEPLRDPSGGLPLLTIDVPFEFDTKPAVAGTIWVELVKDELARPQIPALLWTP